MAVDADGNERLAVGVVWEFCGVDDGVEYRRWKGVGRAGGLGGLGDGGKGGLKKGVERGWICRRQE